MVILYCSRRANGKPSMESCIHNVTLGALWVYSFRLFYPIMNFIVCILLRKDVILCCHSCQKKRHCMHIPRFSPSTKKKIITLGGTQDIKEPLTEEKSRMWETSIRTICRVEPFPLDVVNTVFMREYSVKCRFSRAARFLSMA